MTEKSAAERIAKLRELINDYRYQYHVLDQSIMSEAAADSLKHELSELEAAFPHLITPDSPTQRIAGKPLAGFKTIEHSRRMLSLNDVFDEREVAAWLERIRKLDTVNVLFADIKMDGLACALVYRDGLLEAGITRGDGFVGEDVTANVRTLDSVPLRLKPIAGMELGRTEVRGEIVMYKADFEALNEERASKGLPLFANPRNLAAGTMRQLDPQLVAARKLHFRAYDLQRDDPKEVPSNTFAYDTLSALGFIVNKQYEVIRATAENVMRIANKWEEKRKELPFNTDGLVIKANDRLVFERLGVVGKAPRAAVAYKYPAEQSTTKVKDIFISIGRTGSATPVAMLEPVVVAGSTVQMATLHNEGEVKRKDIRVGDTVVVHKAGDIIPEIVEALTSLRDGSEKPFKMPRECPDCATVLVKAKEADAVWRCPNNSCPSRTWKRVQHYASKTALDIEGLGEKNVITLLQNNLISDAADIYTLTPEDILKLDRFAEVSAKKLVHAIQDKKTPPLHRFLYGLGIRHVGVQTAIDVSNSFKSLDAIRKATIDDLSAVDGVGTVVAEAVVEWFAEPSNAALIDKFEQVGVVVQPVKETSGPLNGKKFVVTGTLNSMGRDQAAERIRQLGGTFQSSLGKDTDVLVVGANVGASKLSKAQKYGTRQMNEDEFLKVLETGSLDNNS